MFVCLYMRLLEINILNAFTKNPEHFEFKSPQVLLRFHVGNGKSMIILRNNSTPVCTNITKCLTQILSLKQSSLY